MSSLTSTTFINFAKEKAKKVFYIVLKKKPFSVKRIEEINKEIEIKLEKFFIKIIPQLNQINPKDKEKFLKYITLKATLKILENIMEKNFMKLTEEDKIAAQKIYENGDKDDFNEKENENNKFINNGDGELNSMNDVSVNNPSS
jgi:hypothetical protein